MVGRFVRDGALQRVHAGGPIRRVVSAALVGLLLGWLAVALASGQVSDLWLPAILLAGHLPVAVTTNAVLEVREDALVIDHRCWRRRIPWDRIRAMTVDLHWGQLRARAPAIERTDGRSTRSGVLVELRRPSRAADRDELLTRLELQAVQHGFEFHVARPS